MESNNIKSNVDGLELYSDNYPFRLPLRIKNFENESEFKKFVRSCEKLVRGSLEYKYWREYIISVLGINECMITEESMNDCTVEIHHHIPSLFVLIKSLIGKKLTKQDEFSSFDIAMETITLHYTNKIGYAVLVKALHEKFHNGMLQIPISLIKGDYKYFIKNYSGFLDDEDMEVLNQRLSIKNEDPYNWSKDNYPGLMAEA